MTWTVHVTNMLNDFHIPVKLLNVFINLLSYY